MELRDILMLLFTFILGLAAGAYVYLIGFAPVYVDNSTTGFETSDDFSLIGEQYGGCQMGGSCRSYRLIKNRSFQLIDPLASNEPITGTYPRGAFRDLNKVLTMTRVEAAARAISAGSCESYVDGIDHRFTVTLEGEEYVLDTCQTALSRDAELQDVLIETFVVIRAPESYSYGWNEFQEAGVLGYFFPQLFQSWRQ